MLMTLLFIWRTLYEEFNSIKIAQNKIKQIMAVFALGYHHTAYNVPCAIEGVLRTEHITCLSKEEWQSVR